MTILLTWLIGGLVVLALMLDGLRRRVRDVVERVAALEGRVRALEDRWEAAVERYPELLNERERAYRRAKLLGYDVEQGAREGRDG